MEIRFNDLKCSAFKERHKVCGWFATEGAKYTYHVTPTGIGTIIKIQCNCCGETKDISLELG